MSYALDTNILLRQMQNNHPLHKEAAEAVEKLLNDGQDVHLLPQNLYELWVVATRPLAQNGSGLSAADALKEITKIKAFFLFSPDTPAVYREWERLVTQYNVIGKNAHDTRIVAAMVAHGVTHLLTLDANHFNRFQEITVVAPQDVLQP